jgi:hypothetical protein
MAYTSYLEHINGENHKITSKNQILYFKEIDQVLDTLWQEKRWENWLTEPCEEEEEE